MKIQIAVLEEQVVVGSGVLAFDESDSISGVWLCG
jgi:hypothetical protein